MEERVWIPIFLFLSIGPIWMAFVTGLLIGDAVRQARIRWGAWRGSG